MRKLVAVLLLSMTAGSASAKECGEAELAEGAALSDGTVAGEKQALEYYERLEPQLYARLEALSAAQRREFAPAFVWFQRVGNCRMNQKKSATEALKIRFGLKHTIIRECREPEYDAGTLMDDGTVAGETQTLDYLQEMEPELYREVVRLPAEELRARFAGALMWFQKVGNCRKRQKAGAILQLKAELLAVR